MTRTSRAQRLRFEAMAAEYLARMGERIRERREALGLSQEDVARAMPGKITGQRISLWERGLHRPRDDSLEALARALEVDVSYFMTPEPAKEETPDLLGVGHHGDTRSASARMVALERKLDKLLEDHAQVMRILSALPATTAEAIGRIGPEDGRLPSRNAEPNGPSRDQQVS
jgi:transcriptional regulator with XRE-family HTH domain